MTIWEAYEKYEIMPNLRLHQLRVAAVARTVAEARGADAEALTKAGLVHDMGNIMKSDLTQFPPEFYGEVGIEYWEGVKRRCGERFGLDEHSATEGIARDMGLDERVIGLIGDMGFSKAAQILARGSIELQILEYADQRVSPYKITSLDDRLREGHARYKARTKTEYGESDDVFEEGVKTLHELERKLFDGLSITPESITEEALRGLIDELRSYEIV